MTDVKGDGLSKIICKYFSGKFNSFIRHSRDTSLFTGNVKMTDYRILSVNGFLNKVTNVEGDGVSKIV